MAARQQDAAAEVVLLNDEHREPYEKPPLSKAVLTGKAAPHDAPIAGPKGVAGNRRRAQGRHAGARRSIAPARDVVTEAGERIALRRARARHRLDQPGAADVSGRPRRHLLPAHRGGGARAQGASASQPVADRDRRRPDRARGGGIRGRARRQDHGDRDRAAHPGARLRRGDLGAHRAGAPRAHGVDIRVGTALVGAARSARWPARGRDPIGRHDRRPI